MNFSVTVKPWSLLSLYSAPLGGSVSLSSRPEKPALLPQPQIQSSDLELQLPDETTPHESTGQ